MIYFIQIIGREGGTVAIRIYNSLLKQCSNELTAGYCEYGVSHIELTILISGPNTWTYKDLAAGMSEYGVNSLASERTYLSRMFSSFWSCSPRTDDLVKNMACVYRKYN